MVIVFAFLYAPLAVMLLFSFNSAKSPAVFKGFSIRWYKELFSNPTIAELTRNMFILAFLSAVIATLLGTAAAVGIFKLTNKMFKSGVMLVTNIPMTNPDIITGISLMLLFVFIGTVIGNTGDKLNFITLLIAHITFNLPYVILNVLPKLRQTDPSVEEAAKDLGASPVKAFFYVVLPSIVPGVVSGFLMSFTLSFDDFIISIFTSGGGFQTLSVWLYNSLKKPDNLMRVYPLYSIIFVVVLTVVLINNKIKIKKGIQN